MRKRNGESPTPGLMAEDEPPSTPMKRRLRRFFSVTVNDATAPFKHTGRWFLSGTWTGIIVLRVMQMITHSLRFFRLVSAADSVHKIARDYTGKYYHLPPVTVYERSVFRRITIPMHDGTKLAATLATPGGPETPRPTILVRTPYGSTGKDPVATLYLERGLNYIVQDTRGRFESGGDFFPIKDERSDGGDTVAWIKEQPWSDGRVGVHGVSYMGMTALAVAGSEDPAVKVTIPVMASSQIYPIAFPAERAVALELLAVWTWLIHEMQNASALVMCFIAEAIFGVKGFAYRRVKRMLDGESKALPLRDVDLRVVGKRVNYIADGLANPDVDLPFWETRNMLADLASGTIRSDIHFVGGWYDFFLHRQLQDFAVTQEAGLESRLTVGPWAHWDMLKYFGPSTRIQVAEYLRHLGGAGQNDGGEDAATAAARVRVYVTGAEEWRGYKTWPPSSDPCIFSILKGGRIIDWQGGDAKGGGGVPVLDYRALRKGSASFERLLSEDAKGLPCESVYENVSSYVYDPEDPTPGLGGCSFNPWNSGAVDCRPLEARSDVLVFTSPRLSREIDIAGYPIVSLVFSSDLPTADVVVRLCDVHPSGKSVNVCDGYMRIRDVPRHPIVVRVELGAAVHRFQPKHKLRLVICSGAHPRIARNLGEREDGTSIGNGMRYVKGEMRVHHHQDPDAIQHGELEAEISTILLPECKGEGWPIPAP